MGLFDRVGDFDESSPLYWLRDTDMRALDQAVKARRAAESARAAAQAVHVSPQPMEQRVQVLENNLLALGLYARTMLGLLHEKGIISPEEFAVKLRELDMLDGKLDGR